MIKPNLLAKMATLFWDVTEIQQYHQPQNKPHCVEKIKGFPLKAKFCWNTATYQKLKGAGFHQPNPVVPQWGSVCMSEGYAVAQWTSSSWQWLSKILWYFAKVRVLTCPFSNGAKNQNLVFWLNWDSAKNFKQWTLEYLTTVLYRL